TWRWSGHPLRQLRADALVVTLLSSLVRSVSPWSEAPPPVRRVLELIQCHPEHRYTLEELCALAGMSGKTLRRYVQLATGMSPSAFVIHCRMQKAHELLIETSQPLKAIASQLGYPDQYTFSHQFKKYFGQSPQAVRRNIY
ncbi:MAG: AraC family transcriptional regulator, partial [Lentisphaerae bacterium]